MSMEGFGGDPMIPVRSFMVYQLDNGYLVTYTELPKPEPVEEVEPEPEADPDQAMDDVVDAIAAFLRHINDRSAGEDWKDGSNGDRQKIRKGLKAFLPNISGQVGGLGGHARVYQPPVTKKLVFQTRAQLMAFFGATLPEDQA